MKLILVLWIDFTLEIEDIVLKKDALQSSSTSNSNRYSAQLAQFCAAMYNWIESFADLQSAKLWTYFSCKLLNFDVTKKAFLAFEMSVNFVAHDLERDM